MKMSDHTALIQIGLVLANGVAIMLVGLVGVVQMLRFLRHMELEGIAIAGLPRSVAVVDFATSESAISNGFGKYKIIQQGIRIIQVYDIE